MLPPRWQAEVLDFARFLQQHFKQQPISPGLIELHPAPTDTLRRLSGLVALGDDALADSEALCDDNGGY